MSEHQRKPDDLRESRYKVGDRVQIVYGREAGHAGVVLEVLPERWRVRYSVETTGGYRTFCEETDLALAQS
jgi:transcription antitermination factor NusG